MFSIGGTSWMLLFAAGAGLLAIVVGLGVGRRMGPLAGFAWFGLAWSVAVIGIVTLVPAQNGLGYIPADQHATSCSWDIGGPSPNGFWIIRGGQRLLNVALFVPSGALMTYACAHARGWAWAMVPWGLVALALFSAGLELTQLGLARLDRACDVTDIVDNVTGAGLGVLLGVTAALVLRPWRRRPRATGR
jgi:hypothetical protein